MYLIIHQIFQKAGSGTNCVDTDECEDGQNGGCDDICVNTPGNHNHDDSLNHSISVLIL